MKILILGGTGAIGNYLTTLLAEHHNELYVSSRKKRFHDKVTYVQGNAHDQSFLESLFREQTEYDAIVDFMSYKTDEFKKRIDLLLDHTSQYVFLSSARVFADSDTPITEESIRLLDIIDDEEYLKTDEYALTKARQENILYQSGKDNWTIVRPYITYSDARLQLGVLEKENWLYRAVQGQTILFQKDIASHYTTMTYGEDVAQMLFSILGNQKAMGRAINVATSESMRWDEVLGIYLDVFEAYLGKRPNVLYNENSMEYASKFNTYQVKYDRLYNRRFDNSLIKDICGSQFSCISMKAGLEKCLLEFLNSERKMPVFDAKFYGWADHISHEKTSLRNFNGVKQKIKYEMYRRGLL